MARITKTVDVPAKKLVVLDHIECELCERTCTNDNWSSRQYEVTRPKVSLTVGENYPEGGYGTETILDICPDCFRDKLVPWFQSLGDQIRIRDIDY